MESFISLTILFNTLFYPLLSQNSLPDCRGVFEGVQYKPNMLIDICVASYLNGQLRSMMYKCDNINGFVVQVTYSGDDCNDQNVNSSRNVGIAYTNQFVNCDSSKICHYALTKSYISNNCTKNTNEWFERLYPVDWCYSYVYGYSTEITCNNQFITSTTYVNTEMTLNGEQIANCDVGHVWDEPVTVVEDETCKYDDQFDDINPYYIEITKCYNSQSHSLFIHISVIFTLLLTYLFV
eukprot:43770_1